VVCQDGEVVMVMVEIGEGVILKVIDMADAVSTEMVNDVEVEVIEMGIDNVFACRRKVIANEIGIDDEVAIGNVSVRGSDSLVEGAIWIYSVDDHSTGTSEKPV
jgi:hypothetical protein